MPFSHDTELARRDRALVNTVELDGDTLVTLADLDDFLARIPPPASFIGPTRNSNPCVLCAPTPQILDSKRSRRGGSSGQPDPRGGRCAALSRHDEWDWHLHVTGPNAPLADRIAADAAMAFLDLIRADALGRLRICAAEDCEDVLVDLSKNSSKRYCDTGNCGNRTNVAAYRARKRQQSA